MQAPSFSSVLRTLGQTSFVGRKGELAKLRDTLDAATSGRGRVILIAGEPGVGKTRIALELAAIAQAGGWDVLFGRSYESEGMPAYMPFVEVLQDVMRASSTDDARAALGSWGVQLGVLLPELPERVPKFVAPTLTSRELERYRLFEPVSEFSSGLRAFVPTPGWSLSWMTSSGPIEPR